MTQPHVTKGFGSGLRRRPGFNNATALSAPRSTLKDSLSNTDREDEANARRLIRVRFIDDRWRRIDRLRVVRIIPPVMPIPAAMQAAVVTAAIVISSEGRLDGYTADH